MDATKKNEMRRYNASECCVFRKTKELNGGLSNMAAGFTLEVNGVFIRTSEALYQACRFPYLPEIQKKIIEQKSPMAAKMVGKPHRNKTRLDWYNVRVSIMRWCLRVKLAQNFLVFGELLESTNKKFIVEESHLDKFWGAKKINEEILEGANVLGRLLMELREEYYSVKDFNSLSFKVEPLEIKDFLLYKNQIRVVSGRDFTTSPEEEFNKTKKTKTKDTLKTASLFGQEISRNQEEKTK